MQFSRPCHVSQVQTRSPSHLGWTSIAPGRRRVPRREAAVASASGSSSGERVGLDWLDDVVAATAKSASEGRWKYFAFGSNLHTSVLEGRRGITPLAQSPGYVKDYRLAFNILGMPLVEPSFASVEYCPGEQVHGMVFTLDWEGWSKLCRTEGVPFGYVPEPVKVQLYSGELMDALTLRASPMARVPQWRETPPSERYRRLICDGAAQRGLCSEWQHRLEREITRGAHSP